MPINIRWQDLELLVANTIKGRYEQLTDEQRRVFCEQIRIADQELQRTGSNNPNYNLPRIGEAYALKYHLGRADNVYTALTNIHQKHSLPENFQMLDIGSGTGGSTMATVIWAARNMSTSLANIQIYGIEPMQMMRDVADYLRQPFLEFIGQQANLALGSMAKNIRHAQQVNSLETLADLEPDPRFNIILFSFTFPSQNADEQQSRLEQIVKVSGLLNTGGLLVFLTPTEPTSKQDFIRFVSQQLISAGIATRLDVNVCRGFYPNTSSFAPQKRQEHIVNLRREINRECRRLNVEDAFGEVPSMDDPYYGFYCTLDALVKN